MTVRTRFAPSPTGRLHLGNVRAAAFNWLFARQNGGAFLLRIEDTDVARNVPGGEEAILEDLRWLGLAWDEGPDVGGPHAPYRQSGRGTCYEETVRRLLARGAAYPCFCSEADVERDAEHAADGRAVLRYSGRCRGLPPEQSKARIESDAPYVLRFAVPEGPSAVVVEDRVFGTIEVPITEVDDFVLRRTDGRVTYNFAVVSDDVDMRITHVIRGVGHLSNTPKQALLFDAMGEPRPVFAHLPTVLGPDGRKLSKREGAAAVSDLRERGFPPDAVLNYLSLLGWSHPGEQEVLTRDQLIASISLERVGRSDTQMDPEKLQWISAQHLASEDVADLTRHVVPFIDRDRFPGAVEDAEAVVDVLRSRLATYAEINDHLPILFPSESETDPVRRGVGADPAARPVLECVLARLEATERWDADSLGDAVRAAGGDAGAKGAALFHPVRLVLIGAERGPDLGKILASIGRDEALRRFVAALA